ncbi:MAG: L-isoaspartyl protein carboxyl methyltransferase [Patescibacteria group bacterium]
MKSNKQLVDYLVESGAIQTKKVEQAFLAMDRINFVPEKWRSYAYLDKPIEITEGQTISQPTTVAFMLELLGIRKGDYILDIGAGSGWVSCLMGSLTGKSGKVYAYESNPSMGMFGKKAVYFHCRRNVIYTIGKVQNYWHKINKVDKIHSGAAFKKIPENLLDKLKINGVLIAPTQKNDIQKIERTVKGFKKTSYPGFLFVPFRD